MNTVEKLITFFGFMNMALGFLIMAVIELNFDKFLISFANVFLAGLCIIVANYYANKWLKCLMKEKRLIEN